MGHVQAMSVRSFTKLHLSFMEAFLVELELRLVGLMDDLIYTTA
jgi:hypothetical protein